MEHGRRPAVLLRLEKTASMQKLRLRPALAAGKAEPSGVAARHGVGGLEPLALSDATAASPQGRR